MSKSLAKRGLSGINNGDSLPRTFARHRKCICTRRFFKGNKRSALVKAGVLIAAIALLDWRVVGEIPLGFLYLVPMLIVGGVLDPGRSVRSRLCAPFWRRSSMIWPGICERASSRDVLYFAAFIGAGFFVREVNRNRRAALEHLHEIERQSDARRDAEEQLRILIESSPAAILTADADGCVLMANEAAHRMLGVPQGDLPEDRFIVIFLP